MRHLSDADVKITFIATKDAARMAALHAETFERPWGEAAFSQALATPHGAGFAALQGQDWLGFILLQGLGTPIAGRAGEAEILTLGVHPEARRRGIGSRLIAHARTQLSLGKILLEVAADNQAALALYAASGFQSDGRRPAYYKNPDGSRVDAILMHAFFS